MSDLSGKNLWEQLDKIASFRFLLLFACGWALIEFFTYFQSIIAIFTMAAILAFLLNYPTRSLSRFLPHSLAVSLVFLLSLLLIGIFTITIGLSIVSQGQQLLDSITNFLSSLHPLLEQFQRTLSQHNIQVDIYSIEQSLRTQILEIIGGIIATSQVILTNLLGLILVAVVAFFMLLDGEKLWKFILKFFPVSIRERFSEVIQRNFLAFFRGQLLLSLFFSIAIFILFLFIQVPFSLVLALIGGIFEAIPGIGATLGISLIAVIVLTQDIFMAVKVLIGCLIIQQIKDNLIAPHIMQNFLNLNPVVVFFALLIGARIGGLLGIFMAIPIAGIIVSLFEIEDMKSVTSEPKE